MTNEELLAKIKAEIERRYKEFDGKTGDIATTSRLAYLDVISFLNTLESEKPMNQEGLKEEYKDYVESDPVYSKLVNRNAGLSIARHFAKWGAEHAREQMMKEGNVILAEEDFNAEKEKSMEWGYNLCKEQMMEEAGEGEVVKDINNKLAVTAKNVNLDKFKFGDKVLVIVCKKEVD